MTDMQGCKQNPFVCLFWPAAFTLPGGRSLILCSCDDPLLVKQMFQDLQHVPLACAAFCLQECLLIHLPRQCHELCTSHHMLQAALLVSLEAHPAISNFIKQ